MDLCIIQPITFGKERPRLPGRIRTACLPCSLAHAITSLRDHWVKHPQPTTTACPPMHAALVTPEEHEKFEALMARLEHTQQLRVCKQAQQGLR